MPAHDGFDGLGRFIGIVERNGGDVVMEDVGFNDPVEEMTANETELAIDCCCRSSGKVPSRRLVVRERWIGVLEKGNGHFHIIS